MRTPDSALPTPGEPAAGGRRVPPTPRDVERDFGPEEIFFSTTDLKGRIRSGNRVFTRVSAYARAEMVGRAHNLVRHPDMPRIIFRRLWEEIQAGRPVAAYVKNLAGDGAYYWVLATVVPCSGGYLSVRIKPATTHFATARALYGDLLALEQSIEGGVPRRREEAMEASRALLLERLQAAGFADDNAFQRTALLAEVQQRHAGDGRRAGLSGQGRASSVADPVLAGILAACETVSDFLDPLVVGLDRYVALNAQLREKASVALDVADDVGLFSLNALLAATRVGGASTTLGTVATLMQRHAEASTPSLHAVSDDIVAALDLLNELFVPAAAARLQVEATRQFVHELLEQQGTAQATADDLGVLAACLAEGTERLGATLATLDRRMRTLASHVARVRSDLGAMRMLEFSGRVEAARMDNADAVVALFGSIAERLATARREMEALAALGRVSFAGHVAGADRSQDQVRRLHEHVRQIAA